MTSRTIILFITAVSTSLVAGLFYSYTCSVTLGLGRLSNGAFLGAMQSINRAILNPLFFVSFMGTLLLLPVSTYLQFDKVAPMRFYLLLTATILYFIGVFAVTMAGNVPLNNVLDKLDIPNLSAAERTQQRSYFELRWNNLNTIRTISSFLATVFVIWACLTGERAKN